MGEMTWHYNLIRTGKGSKYDPFYYRLHEVYVEHGKKDKISWTIDPVTVGGESPEEVVDVLDAFLKELESDSINK